MRTPKRKSLAATDLTAAWAAVLAETKTEDLATYRAAGWKTIQDVAEETGRNEVTIAGLLRNLTKQGKVESKCIRADVGTRIQKCLIYRPK